MTQRLDIVFWIGGFAWAFLLGLVLPYAALLFHLAVLLSDWFPVKVNNQTGLWISRAAPFVVVTLFLIFQVVFATRRAKGSNSKALIGFLAAFVGIIGIGLGIFVALKLGLLPGAPAYV